MWGAYDTAHWKPTKKMWAANERVVWTVARSLAEENVLGEGSSMIETGSSGSVHAGNQLGMSLEEQAELDSNILSALSAGRPAGSADKDYREKKDVPPHVLSLVNQLGTTSGAGGETCAL